MIPTSPQSQKARHERFRFKDHVSSWLGAKTMRRKIWRLSMRERRSLNRSRTSVVRKFKEMMKDASVRDWKNLARVSNLRQSVYVYDHESKSVRHPGKKIEWPTIWLLSAFHRKHIFVPQKNPETKHINDDAIRLTRRVEWRGLLAKTAHVYQAIASRHVKSRVVHSRSLQFCNVGLRASGMRS